VAKVGLVRTYRADTLLTRAIDHDWTVMREKALDEDLREQACEWAERTAIECGLPPKIKDVATLRRTLLLMGFLDTEKPD
jgi:hypothetical protein